MGNTKKAIEAADACRDNASETVLDKFGLSCVEAMSFNEHLNAVNLECLSQASYYAEEFGVSREEVLSALHLSDNWEGK